MVDPGTGRAPRLVRRGSPFQATAMLVVVCGMAALNVYGHPAPAARFLSLALLILLLAAAVACLRMYLVADAEGVAVRFVGPEAWIPWPELERIELAQVRGAHTVRLVRTDGRHVDVPPSLLQPTLPTTAPKALARLRDVAGQLEDLRVGR